MILLFLNCFWASQVKLIDSCEKVVVSMNQLRDLCKFHSILEVAETLILGLSHLVCSLLYTIMTEPILPISLVKQSFIYSDIKIVKQVLVERSTEQLE